MPKVKSNWGWERFSVPLAALAMLALFVYLFFTFFDLKKQNDLVQVDANDSPYLGLSEIEVVLLKFSSSLDRYALEDPNVTATQVKDRYDSLWSRLELVKSSHSTQSFSNMTAALGSISALQERLFLIEKRIENVEQLSFRQLREIREDIRLFESEMHVYPRLAALGQEQNVRIIRERATAIYQRITFAIIGILLLGSFLFFLLVWERKRAQSSENTLASAVSTMPDAFALFDADDRLVMSNSRFYEDLGFSENEKVHGASYTDLFRRSADLGTFTNAQQNSDAWIDKREEAHRKHGPVVQEPLSDGRWVRLAEKATPSGGTILISTDISEVKNRENELLTAKEQAEAGDRAKSDFLAMMSHEIRTPMNGVLGMTSMLMETSLNKQQQFYAQTATDSAHSLLTILDDILDLSKFESGKMLFEELPFDLAPLASGAIDLMSATADEKGLDLKLDLHPDLPKRLVADPSRLRQVLLNLLGNAIKFTRDGSVTLRVLPETAPRILDDATQHQLRFEIQDTGIGIDAETQEALFSPFMQADAATSREFGGTGLGLAICKRLVEAMNGRIAVDSVKGQGSNFYFILPLTESKDQAVEQLDETAAPIAQSALEEGKNGGNWSVLLVEDSQINITVAKAMLKDQRLDITIANDGVEAVEAMAANTYDLVFMDISMPRMDGLTATTTIRASDKLESQSTPIIALTANALASDREKCLEVGMDDFLAKPLEKSAMFSIINKWLSYLKAKMAQTSPSESQSESQSKSQSASHSSSGSETSTDKVEKTVTKSVEDVVQAAPKASVAEVVKAPEVKTTDKVEAKEPAPEKAPAKKAPAKKATVKKPVAKKPAAKKATVKKTSEKKPSEKAAVAKKTPAKKTTATKSTVKPKTITESAPEAKPETAPDAATKTVSKTTKPKAVKATTKTPKESPKTPKKSETKATKSTVKAVSDTEKAADAGVKTAVKTKKATKATPKTAVKTADKTGAKPAAKAKTSAKKADGTTPKPAAKTTPKTTPKTTRKKPSTSSKKAESEAAILAKAESAMALADATAAARTDGLIDKAVLRQLANDTGPDIIRVLVGGFIEEMDLRVIALDVALKAGDLDKSRHEAHTIKGSSATFGAMAVSNAAKDAEYAATDGDLALTAKSFASLTKLYDRTKVAFDVELDALKS
ncbi:MAG: ATP-binding protein [Alphaproteobacteria bacterium]